MRIVSVHYNPSKYIEEVSSKNRSWCHSRLPLNVLSVCSRDCYGINLRVTVIPNKSMLSFINWIVNCFSKTKTWRWYVLLNYFNQSIPENCRNYDTCFTSSTNLRCLKSTLLYLLYTRAVGLIVRWFATTRVQLFIKFINKVALVGFSQPE